jgi:NAD(P)-dependent dehydrogenase (short-subunit alcohol dehydrogenase family)
MTALTGHTGLVTGAGRRLGRAFAEALAEEGANVVVHYGSSAQEAEQVVKVIQQHGIEAIALQGDLSNPQAAEEVFASAIQSMGEIDILINNAAIFGSATALQTTLTDWQRHLDINLTSPFLLSQAFAQALGDRPGSIVNLLDWRALQPGDDHFAYNISKAGLSALTRGLALALAPNVRVNGLALGAILPPEGGGEGDPLEGVPAGRWGTVEEAVEGLLFLLTASNYITGEILHIDGGRHLT